MRKRPNVPGSDSIVHQDMTKRAKRGKANAFFEGERERDGLGILEIESDLGIRV